jgi:hypothetical protein
MFELYVLNETEVFFGYHPVQEHTVKVDGDQVAMWDLMGKDAKLIHHSADKEPDSMASQYLAQSKMWFDSLWATVARPVEQ